jgi:hypothetical protein
MALEKRIGEPFLGKGRAPTIEPLGSLLTDVSIARLKRWVAPYLERKLEVFLRVLVATVQDVIIGDNVQNPG